MKRKHGFHHQNHHYHDRPIKQSPPIPLKSPPKPPLFPELNCPSGPPSTPLISISLLEDPATVIVFGGLYR